MFTLVNADFIVDSDCSTNGTTMPVAAVYDFTKEDLLVSKESDSISGVSKHNLR